MRMRPHFHTDAVQIGMTALGVLVVIHAMRLAAIALAKSDRAAGLGKALGAFALAD